MEITVIEMQSENHPYGDPDQGVPEEALRMFLKHYPTAQEDSVCMGEHEFIIWRGEHTEGQYGTFFANAWTLPNANAEREYTTYYELLSKAVIDVSSQCITPYLNGDIKC